MTGTSILRAHFQRADGRCESAVHRGECHPTSSLPEMAGRIRTVIAFEWIFPHILMHMEESIRVVPRMRLFVLEYQGERRILGILLRIMPPPRSRPGFKTIRRFKSCNSERTRLQ